MKLIEISKNNLMLTTEQLQAEHELVLEIQTKLHEFGLYPNRRWLDGQYGQGTAKSLNTFGNVMQLHQVATQPMNPTLANALLNTDSTEFRLKSARNQEEVFQEFLAAQPHPQTGGGFYLDRGIDQSPYQAEISNYPQRLKEKPDETEVVSLKNSKFESYPLIGKQPKIEPEALNFLHSDIKEACVCIGSIINGKMQTCWLGKNALDNIEFWSATKIEWAKNNQLIQGYPNGQF